MPYAARNKWVHGPKDLKEAKDMLNTVEVVYQKTLDRLWGEAEINPGKKNPVLGNFVYLNPVRQRYTIGEFRSQRRVGSQKTETQR